MKSSNREDLEDKIYRVAPEKTPFLSSIGQSKASNTYHEWQTETLATPNASNAAYEGDDISAFSNNVPARLGNTCQIFTQAVSVSNTQEAIKSAGRASDMGRLRAIKMLELRRDMEAAAIANRASVPTETYGTTKRATAGALAFIATNASRGSTGASGGFSAGTVAAATNGAQRAVTEGLLKSVLQQMFAAGADVDGSIVMTGGTQKQNLSAFQGLNQYRLANPSSGSKQATITAGAEIYVSDFGQVTFQPHAYFSNRDCLIYSPDNFSWGVLRGAAEEELSTTGDSAKRFMVAEGTLVCHNERGSGVIADLL